jgi:hypothetical protein
MRLARLLRKRESYYVHFQMIFEKSVVENLVELRNSKPELGERTSLSSK